MSGNRDIALTAEAVAKSLPRRNRRQVVLKIAGLMSILVAFGVLCLLIGSLVSSGHKAFTQTQVTIDVYVDPEVIEIEALPRGNFKQLQQNSMQELYPMVTGRADRQKIYRILSNGAQFSLRDRVVETPSLIGTTISLTVPASDPYDQFNKGVIKRETPEEYRRLSDREIEWFDRLKAGGAITKPFNTALFTNADSRFPELAGLKGAMIGSFWALLVCFLLSFPLGIGAAVYLEEFAPKNRFSNIIEVNINNLAAVPSVVFGLLALAIFIGWFGLPRSAPLVGGMTLA